MNTVTKMLLVVMIFFVGCGRETKINRYTLAKEKLYVSSIDEVTSKIISRDTYVNENNIPGLLYSEDVNDTANNYLFIFPFRIVTLDRRGDASGITGMSIDLCKNGVIAEKDYPLSSRNERVLRYDNGIHEMYLPFERLQNKGLLSDLPENQEDICLYLKYSGLFSTYGYVLNEESNILTFTAEEINTARAEYESLML